MQKVSFKILLTYLIYSITGLVSASANTPENELIRADSLYENKQFTQAIKIYNNLFSEGYTSPNMLLKLARVHEGKQEYGLTIYYLEKYFQLTNDEAVLNYIDKLTSDKKISGFSYEFPFYLNYYYQEYRIYIIFFFATALLISVASLLKFSEKRRSLAYLCFVFALLITAANNYKGQQYGIITQTPTFIMEGPSAGADVLIKLDVVTKLPIKGEKDVWTKTYVNEKKAFVKTEQLKKL